MDDQLLMDFYEKWYSLSPGPKAEFRRVREPDDLLDRPAFYRFVASLGWEKLWRDALARLLFCAPYIKPSNKITSLGAALGATGKISEKRIYQVMRSEYPNDIVHLRRLLQHVKPEAHWPSAARQIYFWHGRDMDKVKKNKRRLLEDFILNQSKKTAA